MKITEYGRLNRLNNDNVFLVDGPSGTKTITKSDLMYDLFDGIPQMHNQIWRGKNLGTRVTQEQLNEIKNGTFHDLWLGDYWELKTSGSAYPGLNNNKFVIMDFDYFYNINAFLNTINEHHVVIMPRNAFADGVQIHSEDSLADTGLLNCDLIKTLFPKYQVSLNNAFSSMGVPEIYEKHLLNIKTQMISNINYDARSVTVTKVDAKLMLPHVGNINSSIVSDALAFMDTPTQSNALSINKTRDNSDIYTKEFSASKYINGWYKANGSNFAEFWTSSIAWFYSHDRKTTFNATNGYTTLASEGSSTVYSVIPYFCLK